MAVDDSTRRGKRLAVLLRQAFRNGAKLEIRAKNGHFDFSDSDNKIYASLGKYVSDFASFENDIDDFISLYSVKFPRNSFAISKTRPFKIDQKAAFFVYCHVLTPSLREVGDPDGVLDLNYIYYAIIDLFGKRNNIVHGTVLSTDSNEEGFVVRARKYGRRSGREINVDEYIYSSEYLYSALTDLHYLRTFVWRAREVLEGKDVRSEREQYLKGQIALRLIKANPEIFGKLEF